MQIIHDIALEIWYEAEPYLPDLNTLRSKGKDFSKLYNSGKEFTQVSFYFRTPDTKVDRRELIRMTNEDADEEFVKMEFFNDILQEATRRRLYDEDDYFRTSYYNWYRVGTDVGFCHMYRHRRILGDDED